MLHLETEAQRISNLSKVTQLVSGRAGLGKGSEPFHLTAVIELTARHSARTPRAGEVVVKIGFFVTGSIISSPGRSFLRKLGGKTEVPVACPLPLHQELDI